VAAEWVNYSEFRFSHQHVLFALENLNEIKQGKWPVKGHNVGNKAVQAAASHKIAAEIEYRLSKSGLDRNLAEDRYINGHSELEISKRFGLEYNEVVRSIEAVTWYCTGSKRKRQSYRVYRWNNHRKDRKSGTK